MEALTIITGVAFLLAVLVVFLFIRWTGEKRKNEHANEQVAYWKNLAEKRK